MQRTKIKEVSKHDGEQVKINGFVQALRNQGKIAFVIVRDVTGTIQCVVLQKENEEVFNKLEDLHLESVVEVKGIVKSEQQAPGGYELAIEELTVLSAADANLPIPVVVEKGGEETDVSIRFDWRWVDLRKPEKQKFFKVWTELEKGFRKYYENNGYTQLYAPSIMSSPSESGAEVFEVKYFDRTAYLAQSPQFYKQLAMAAGFEKVFMVGPVFRAEPSFTTRHMTEFTGWDFEISYIKDHHDVMDELEALFVSGFEQVNSTVMHELEVPQRPFPRVTMQEAKQLLSEVGVPSEKSYDVSPEEERKLCEIFKEKTGSDFVFLIDYPIEARPFYHMRFKDNPKITMSYDLLYKGLELVTGAQREHRPEYLEKQAKEKGMDPSEVDYYIDFFRNGCPPHGGGGIGPARIIMQIMGISSVKEVTFLPRDVKRISP